MMTATKYLDFPSLYEWLTETVPPRLLSPGLNRVFSRLSQVKPFFEPRHLGLDAVPDSELGTGEFALSTPSNSPLDYLSGIVPNLPEPLAVSDSLIKNVSQPFPIDVAEAETTSTPTVETDKQDYQPGETATITATGFDPGAVVKLQVQHLEAGADGEFGTADDLILASSNSGSGHEPWVVKDGSFQDLDGEKNGEIVTEWYVNPDDSANETFLLTATDLKTAEAAEPHIFTDSVLDLTGTQSAGFVNGSYIVRSDLASGAGTNDSFLKLRAKPDEEGFNTDAAVHQPDVKSARSLQLSELQQVTIAGETFREVRLDLNEKNSASEITLQEFRLFLGNSATLSAYDPSNQTLIGALNNGQAVFDLGGSVLLDASLTPGTSSFDASIYVPETAFSGAIGSTYVYLFSKLVSSDGGFEEFAVADVAGIDPEGTISGRVFEDVNGDGDDEAGADPNLDGVTIKLFLDDGDGVFEANEGAFDPTKDSLVTTTTSANGSYSFGDVLAGDYFVRQVTPTDLIQTTTDPSLITIGSNTTVTDVDFGNVEEFGSISGQKFEDIDGDGIKDAGEAGLAGWTIFIDANDNGSLDTGETSTTTDAHGNYSFTDLTAGDYTIREVQQTGWEQTTSNPSAINITSGTNATGVNFGNFQLGSISGQKFEDSDGDGVKDAGEAGLAGWTIFIDANDNGSLDTGETSTTTDSHGNYSFTDLTVGTYTIREVQQTGWEQTTSNPSAINITSGTNATGVNFGNFQLGSISGQKFEDSDGDGVKDAGEAGLAGWTIFIDSDNDDVLDAGETSTTTDSNGNYSFTDLSAGNYTIREVQQTGWLQTTTNPSAINVTSGTDATGVDFGNFELGSISGQKFEDTDGDGVKDAGEAGLAGWTIFIDSDNDGVLDVGETSTTTDTNGNYSFTDLTAGNYTIREVQQTGWQQTTTNPSAINVTSGTDTTGVDFGNFQLGSISGQKFEDTDGDGVKDAGEAGLANWTIFIDANDNGSLDTGETSTTTDSHGNYSFTDLTVGTYTIREVQQTGWQQTTSNPSAINITSGTNATGVNFGNFQLGTISGQKFEDIDGDGVKDAGEAGLANWTIFIDANDNGSLDTGETSTTTDANGNYSFTDLTAGDYTIREVQQTGWEQTTSNPSAINITSGTNATGVNFGNFQLGTISGQKFEDIDGDGVKDAGETGLAGWTIFIDANDNGSLDAGETSTVTDGSGNYSFTDLTVGTYTIREDHQAGWVQKTTNPAPITVESGTNATDINFGNRQEVDVEVVKAFIPTYEGENVFIPGEQRSYTLTVTNNGIATAQSVLINDPGNIQLDVSELILPANAIDLDTYDLNEDGTLDSYLTANGQYLTGDGDPNTIEVVIPSLLSGESVQLTVNTTVSSAYVQEFNVYASLGDNNSTLPEYYNSNIKGTNWIPIDGIEKSANSPWILVQKNIVGSNASALIYSNTFDTNSNNNVSENLGSYGVIPFARYTATLGNGEQLTIHSKLFDPQTDDPQNPEFIYTLNADLCWNNYTQSYDYSINDATCLSLEQSDPAQWRFDNNSTFLSAADEGIGDVNLTWDNKALIEQIPNEWNAFLALDTSNDPTAAQQIIDFYQSLVENGHTANDIFVNGELRVTNLTTNQSELIGITDAQITPDFADTVIILVKTDGVYFADENLTPGTQIIAQNDLQAALDTLSPAANSLSSLKIVIDSPVTTTRLETLDLNALQDKGYLVTDLEILGSTMSFTSQNSQVDLDLSSITVTAPVNANVELLGRNGADTIEGSSFSEIIKGKGGDDLLIGGLGNDQVFGNWGNDLMRGDSGDDILAGGLGADTLRGGLGADLLVGSYYNPLIQLVLPDFGASDIYVLEENTDLDTVRGYDVGSDKIGLLGIALNDLVLTQQGADSIISLNGEDIMQVEGVNTADLAFTTSFSYI